MPGAEVILVGTVAPVTGKVAGVVVDVVVVVCDAAVFVFTVASEPAGTIVLSDTGWSLDEQENKKTEINPQKNNFFMMNG